MRKSANKVRITAQLIKAADGYHLWSETYDRALDDIFVVQDDIAGEWSKRCRSLCSAQRSRHVPSHRTRRRTTLSYKGVTSAAKATRKDLERSIDYFRQSLQRDPSYAAGLGGPVAGIRAARPRTVSCRSRKAIDERARPRRKRWRWIHGSLTRIWRWAGSTSLTTGTGRPRTQAYRRALELDPGSGRHAQATSIPGGDIRTLGRSD